jgi:hypothetical protein
VTVPTFGWNDQRLAARSRTAFTQADRVSPLPLAASSYSAFLASLMRILRIVLSPCSGGSGGLPGLGRWFGFLLTMMYLRRLAFCCARVAHRQLPGSYPFVPSILSIVLPGGRSPMSYRKFRKSCQRSQTVTPLAPYSSYPQPFGFVQRVIMDFQVLCVGVRFPMPVIVTTENSSCNSLLGHDLMSTHLIRRLR